MSDAKLNLGCGEDYRDGWVNVDVVPECDPDLVVNLSSFPWPFAAASFDRILAGHVFEHLPSIGDALAECGRILRPGGTVDIRLPIGLDYEADQTHQTRWTWLSPEFATGKRHWDRDTGLELVDRHVDLWSQLPGIEHRLYQRYLEWRLEKFGPGRWCFALPATAGEFRIRFRKGGEPQ